MPARITKPIRPGTVIRFQGEASPQVPPSVAETVAVPITHDWGPANTPVLMTSFPAFEAEFGGSRTLGRNAVLGAFAGQALPGQGGAGGVYVYRMAPGATPAAGHTGGTAPAGLDLLAKHTGTRGNALTATVAADPNDAAKQLLTLTTGGTVIERYSYLKAEPEKLVTAVAQRSNYVHAALGGIKDTDGGITAQARLVSGRTVAIDVSGSPTPMRIVWDDDTPDETEARANSSTQHTYAADGSYSVTVTGPGAVPTVLTLAIVLPWPAATDLTVGTVTLTGGVDFTAPLTIDDWLEACTALEYLPFSALAPFDLTDDTIRAGIVSWVSGQEAANRPVMLVLGGPETESVDDAVANAATFNNAHVIRLAGGYFADAVLGASVTTSQLAPRVAGMLAALGDANSLTFKALGGLTYIGSGFANDEIESAIQNGVTTIAVSTNPVAPLRIERGLTTFTIDDDPTQPRDFFSDPRLVRLVDLFIRRMKEWGDNTMIGNVPVNDDSRTALRAHARAEIDDLLDRGLIVAGTDFLEVPIPTDPEYLDSLIYEFGFQCARTALYIFGFGSVR